MIYVYLALAIVGLGVVGLQIALGGHDAPGGLDVHDAGGGDLDHVDAAGLFLSLRFWSFGSLGTGLVGLLGTLLSLGGPIAVAVASIVTGAIAGAGTTLGLRALSRAARAASMPPSYVGQAGKVLVPPTKDARGKVRLSVAGEIVDVLAVADVDGLSIGDSIVVVEMRGALAVVTKGDPALLGP